MGKDHRLLQLFLHPVSPYFEASADVKRLDLISFPSFSRMESFGIAKLIIFIDE
jgi:hypothetical protein